MAQIKGFALKGVTRFKGHEGEPCVQGNIIYNGKKVGYYTDSFTMGPPNIDFDNENAEKQAARAAEEYFGEHPDELDLSGYKLDPDLDLLFTKIIALIDYEKQYKNVVKKGFPVFAVIQKDNGVELLMAYMTKDAAEKDIAKRKDIMGYKYYGEKDFTIE